MSDASNSHDDGPHEGPIKTPKQLIVAILFSFIAPVIIIVMLVSYVTDNARPAAGSDGLKDASVSSRVAPVGKVVVKDLSNPASMKTGQQVYAAQCSACHAEGLAGAPKLGDAAAWGPRVSQGYDVLLTSALKGKNAMGAQGGGDYSDFEIGRAVVYLANQGGAQFAEPKMEAAAGTAEAAPAVAPEPVPAVVAEAPPAAAPAEAVVVAAAAPVAAAAAVPALYNQACAVCHAAGVAGAPKYGDKAGWSARLAAGVDGLTASAIKGKGAMPPRGGSQGSDADIKAAVAYMVDAVK